MNNLNNLVEQSVYGYNELISKGWTRDDISSYCRHRRALWLRAINIFHFMFKSFAVNSITKELENNTMVVTVRDDSTMILAQSRNKDPIIALIQCGKMLRNSDDYLVELMKELKV